MAALTKAIVLAGGLGTRLRPLTDHTPKCLVPVAGRPLLDYWFDAFAAAGIHDVLINTHYLREKVRAYIDQRNASGAFRIAESFEPELLGSAGTIHANRDFIKDADTALVVYADNLSNVDLSSMLKFHHLHGDPLTMLLFHAPNPEKCGIAQLDSNSRVVEFVEKPMAPKGNLANAGIYALTSRAYHQMADMNGFDLGFDVLPSFVGRMRGWVWNGYHRDIGTPEALQEAEQVAERIFKASSADSATIR
jgi:mannose-1-phosphate guanylyltransferase